MIYPLAKNQIRKSKTMKQYNTIEISLKDGHTAVWEANKGEWDAYSYNGSAFIIKKDSVWVGIYDMDVVRSVI